MEIKFEEHIHYGYLDSNIEIDVNQLVKECDTEQEVTDWLIEYYYENPENNYSLGDIEVEESNVYVKNINEVIEKWKELKSQEASK